MDEHEWLAEEALCQKLITSFLHLVVNGVKCRSYTLLVKDEFAGILIKAATQIAKTIRRGE